MNLNTNPELSGEYAREMLRLVTAAGNDSLIAKAYYNLGLSYYFREFWTLASENFMGAIDSKWGGKSEVFKRVVRIMWVFVLNF